MDVKKDADNVDTLVKKSNALARARWSAESIWEPRLVALLASKVRVDDTDFQVYEIPATEILRGTGGKDYHNLSDIIDSVMARVLTIKEHDGWTKYNLFARCRFRSSDGILELGFHPDLKKHYLNLAKYTKYSLTEFLLLPSIYSQRIYEILKSWDDRQDVLLYVKDLHEMLDTPHSLRMNFKNFRLRVLEKAYNDITNLTGMRFTWEPIKKGRAVNAIRFTFLNEVKKHEQKKEQQTAIIVNKNAISETVQPVNEEGGSPIRRAQKCYTAHGSRVCNGITGVKQAVCTICLLSIQHRQVADYNPVDLCTELAKEKSV